MRAQNNRALNVKPDLCLLHAHTHTLTPQVEIPAKKTIVFKIKINADKCILATNTFSAFSYLTATPQVNRRELQAHTVTSTVITRTVHEFLCLCGAELIVTVPAAARLPASHAHAANVFVDTTHPMYPPHTTGDDTLQRQVPVLRHSCSDHGADQGTHVWAVLPRVPGPLHSDASDHLQGRLQVHEPSGLRRLHTIR